MESLGVYIQFPFCASKCSFCNFSSRVARPQVLEAYVEALLVEINHLRDLYAPYPFRRDLAELAVDTIYLGGGTPSILGGEQLEKIVHNLRCSFRLAPEAEFTLEMTPGSAGSEFLSSARSLGVNRLSLGAQSLDDRELRAVGRLHCAQDTCDLVKEARRAGYGNINLDLIAGLPHQQQISWRGSLAVVRELRPEHISVYLFEMDEKSRLGAELLRHGDRYHAESVPDDDFLADAYEFARAELTEAGYTHYEISNFALPGFESRHNLKYWQLQPYLGLGAGAHSFDGAHRWANETHDEVYRQKLARGESPVAEWRPLNAWERLEEYFFLGLRKRAGIDLATARELWGGPLPGWEAKISALVREGWLERQADRVRVPPHAFLVSNEIFQEFLI